MNPIGLVRRYVKAHHISRVVLVLGGIVAALVFFVVGAGVRLLIGPVSLGPFAGALADAINQAVPGIAVKYDQAAIEWERDEGRVNLVILGTRVFDVDGRIIAQAPKADVDLAAAPLLHGHIVVKRIALVGVQLTLVRTKDGGLHLGVEKDRQELDILSRISDALKAHDGSTSSLESFAVRGARLAFFDESTGLFVVAPRADFWLARVGRNLDAKVDAAVEISGHPAHVTAEVSLPPAKGPVVGAIAVTGFEVTSLAANSKAFAAVKDTALKVDVAGRFVVNGTSLRSAVFGLTAKGAFTVPEVPDGRVRVSDLRAMGRYDGARRRLSIESASIDSDKIKARLQGRVDIVSAGADALAGLRADLRMNELSLAWPGVFAEPVLFQLVDLRGAWDRAQREFVIDHLGVSGKPLAMQASGTIALSEGQSPAVEVTGSVAPVPVRDLLRYWPVDAARGARGWADASMPAAVVGPTSFELHFAAGLLDKDVLPPETLSVKFAVNGGEVVYIKGLTHLTNVQGTATVTGKSFTADVSSAKIGPLAVSAVRFAIEDFNDPDESGDIAGHIRGAMPDVLALIDQPPLRYPSRFGISPNDVKGDANVDLTVRVPMKKELDVGQVGIGVKAAVAGFGAGLGPHTQLTDGTMNLLVDNAKLHATGTVGIGGSPARLSIDWTEDFKALKPVTTRIAVKGVLDEVARAALNVGPRDYLKGPIGINGTLTGRRGSLAQGNLTLDLTPASLSFDLIGVNKPAGFPMSARVGTTFGPKSAVLSESIRITGPGASVVANAKFDPGGRVIQLQAPSVHLGPQNDFSLTLARSDAGLDVAVRGRALDGSHLAHQGSDGGAMTFDEPFHLNVKLDRLALRNGVSLAPFSLDASGIADRPAAMTLSASLSKTTAVTGSIAPVEAGRRVTLATNDTGTLLNGLFGFNSMRGGKLEFAAMLSGKADTTADPDGPDYQGKVVLKDFRMLNQPFLARVFSAGSLAGLGNLLQGEGIAVDSLEIPFASRNGVISVHGARATGPSIGITADGYVDRPKNDIALKGSLVPLYGINSVLGNIPLLGDVLTSKAGEGIIGMTYSVSGNADEPNVTVNPLSALAPGIFRRIFEGRMPNAAQAPSNAPKPMPPQPAPVAPPAAPPTPVPKPQPSPAKPLPKSL